MADFGVTERTYVIAGGTTGLGFSAAEALVRNGARVGIGSRSEESVARALEALGENAVGRSLNASDPGSVGELIELTCKQFGDLHGLYHVAGEVDVRRETVRCTSSAMKDGTTPSGRISAP